MTRNPDTRLTRRVDRPRRLELHCQCGWVESFGAWRNSLPEHIRAQAE
jgi:hypothetical protein